MIRVTIYNEFVQEQNGVKTFDFMRDWNVPSEMTEKFRQMGEQLRQMHGGGIHNTLSGICQEDDQIEVRHIATLDMEQHGLTEDVLHDTDVLLWWAHIAHDQVSEEVAWRVVSHVQRGMGIIFLHSAHLCKPMRYLLGTTCTLRWREGDFCRVWNINPTHPIAKGIDDFIELEVEEMYGEYFDIPKPDDVIFNSWYRGGELFRSGCTWTRAAGRIFYFGPGHENNHAYFHPQVRQIIRNAVRWCAEPNIHLDKLECIEVHGYMDNRM